MDTRLDAATQLGPILVTLAYLLVYYAAILRVAWVKSRLATEYSARGEKFDRYFGQDRHMLAADRAHLNILEQMPPFLVLLWMNAVFVGPNGATIAGGVYVAARAAYPFLIGDRMGRGIRASVLLATGPGYLVLLYFLGALAYAILPA
ncbi:MAG: MAPEG family protein [Alphaproteobacteria bacterium]|nr:MAPEG family protein [Alphaproteobacteria bacterium]